MERHWSGAGLERREKITDACGYPYLGWPSGVPFCSNTSSARRSSVVGQTPPRFGFALHRSDTQAPNWLHHRPKLRYHTIEENPAAIRLQLSSKLSADGRSAPRAHPIHTSHPPQLKL